MDVTPNSCRPQYSVPPSRTPAGSPHGGQFSASRRKDPDINLATETSYYSSEHVHELRKGGRMVASAEMLVWNKDGQQHIYIEMIQSFDQQKGYANEVIQEVYDMYPNARIDWGVVVHPAALKLAERYRERYPDRTTYYVDEESGLFSGHAEH